MLSTSQHATLRLFKALVIDDKNKTAVNENLNRQTVKLGFVFSAEVVGNYPDLTQLVSFVDDLYGKDPEKLNKAFHKSFAKVRDSSLAQLYFEQVVHYLTTYGAEAYGVYHEDSVFIPAEVLNAPEIAEGTRLVVIHGLTPNEIKEKLLSLLKSGVALSEESVRDAVDIAMFVGLRPDEIESTSNREVKSVLYDIFGIVPGNPVEFLRYVVQKTTGETLLIKNRDLTKKIKVGVQTQNITPFFVHYENEHGIERLGEIFYRFKPIFLAFRANSKLRPVINKIRRLAESNHKPLSLDYLNNVTFLLKKGLLEQKQLELQLNNVNVFRKIRLAQALKVRTLEDLNSISYRIRNGKSFSKEFEPFVPDKGTAWALRTVLHSIANDIEKNVAGRSIYVPEGVVYGLPATEKQFTGNFPIGTYVEVIGPMVCGIYWEDQGRNRIDLDLSLLNQSGKYGWDGGYRSLGDEIYFSGDNTSAPHGASEVFHIGNKAQGVWSMNVNYFNYDPRTPVPFKIVVGKFDGINLNKYYVIDPNHLVAEATSVIDVKQKNLGIIVCDKNTRRFYFSESAGGGGNSARNNIHAQRQREFLHKSLMSAITLNDVLRLAGAQIVSTPEPVWLDLSPEAIDKTTILNLLS